MQEKTRAGGSARFRGIAGSVITKVFGLYIGKTGLIRQEALNYGFDPIEGEIESITRAGYYPGSKSIWIKIIADRKSRRILGSQIVGGEGVKERIDLIALAMLLKADISDLASYDASSWTITESSTSAIQRNSLSEPACYHYRE